MSAVSEPIFKPPPIIECISQARCLGIGKKIHRPDKVCISCLKRYDPQQLRVRANGNPSALSLIEEEVNRKHETRRNIEAHSRYLCAFEDPTYQHCRWRESDLNLRGTRLDCTTVRRRGQACKRCWKRYLRKIGIVQHFTPTGLCHEESDKTVTRPEGTGKGTEGGDDDVEGYDFVFD